MPEDCGRGAAFPALVGPRSHLTASWGSGWGGDRLLSPEAWCDSAAVGSRLHVLRRVTCPLGASFPYRSAQCYSGDCSEEKTCCRTNVTTRLRPGERRTSFPPLRLPRSSWSLTGPGAVPVLGVKGGCCRHTPVLSWKLSPYCSEPPKAGPRGLEQEEARDCLTLPLAFDEKRPEKLRTRQRAGSGDSGLATLPGRPLWAWDGLQLPDPCGHTSLRVLPQTRAKVPESAGFQLLVLAGGLGLGRPVAPAVGPGAGLGEAAPRRLPNAFSGSFAGAVL